MSSPSTLNPTKSNLSAGKLLTLLETLTMLDESVRLQDLAAMLSMNASTVLRFLAPLQERGYVIQDTESSRYRITYKICGLANNVRARTDIRNIALPYLKTVAYAFKETANLTVERDMSVLYLEVVNYPGKSLMIMQRIGHVAPLHCTGVGKLFLSQCEREKVAQYVATKGLPRFTEKTITDPVELDRALAEIRLRGYAFDNEECEIGARCIAAPVRDYTRQIIAGISVSGPVLRMTDDHIFQNISFLCDAARQISIQLGWNPPTDDAGSE